MKIIPKFFKRPPKDARPVVMAPADRERIARQYKSAETLKEIERRKGY